MRYLIILFICLILASCSGKRGYLKYKVNHKEVFAQDCLDAFPTKETFIIGKDSIIERTLTVKGDSIPCPAIPGVTKTVYVKCPDAKIIYRDRLRVDTVRLEDTRIKFLNDKLQAENIQALKEAKVSQKLASNRLWIIISMGIVIGGLIYFMFIRR